jgi:hypothetical protein
MPRWCLVDSVGHSFLDWYDHISDSVLEAIIGNDVLGEQRSGEIGKGCVEGRIWDGNLAHNQGGHSLNCGGDQSHTLGPRQVKEVSETTQKPDAYLVPSEAEFVDLTIVMYQSAPGCPRQRLRYKNSRVY